MTNFKIVTFVNLQYERIYRIHIAIWKLKSTTA